MFNGIKSGIMLAPSKLQHHSFSFNWAFPFCFCLLDVLYGLPSIVLTAFGERSLFWLSQVYMEAKCKFCMGKGSYLGF